MKRGRKKKSETDKGKTYGFHIYNQHRKKLHEISLTHNLNQSKIIQLLIEKYADRFSNQLLNEQNNNNGGRNEGIN